MLSYVCVPIMSLYHRVSLSTEAFLRVSLLWSRVYTPRPSPCLCLVHLVLLSDLMNSLNAFPSLHFSAFPVNCTGAFGLPPLFLHVPWQKGTGHGYGGGKDSGLHESTLRSVFSHQQIVDTLEPILKLPGQYVLVSCNQGYH